MQRGNVEINQSGSMTMNKKSNTLSMVDLWEREVYELQKSLQNSFIRQKNLIERVDELTAKVAILGGDPNQLELRF